MSEKAKDILDTNFVDYVISTLDGLATIDDADTVFEGAVYKKIHFLLQHYRIATHPEALDKAIASTEKIVRLWTQNKSYHCGYQGGRGEIAQVLLRLYELTDNTRFLDHIEHIFLPYIAAFNGCSRSGNNFYEGRAGVLFNLLHFQQYRTANEMVSELISALITSILVDIIIDPEGNYHLSKLGTRNTNGFGYGVSGVAYIFDIVARFTNQKFYKEVAERFVRTEDLDFNAAVQNWNHKPVSWYDFESYVQSRKRFIDEEPTPVFLDDSFLATRKLGMQFVRGKIRADQLSKKENVYRLKDGKTTVPKRVKAYKDVVAGKKISESDLCILLDLLYEDQCDFTKGNSSYKFPQIPEKEVHVSLKSTPSFHQLNEHFFNTHYSVSRQFLNTYCPLVLEEFFKSHDELVLEVLERYIFENETLDNVKVDWIKEIVSFESVLLKLRYLQGNDASRETKQVFEFEKACEILEKPDEEIMATTFALNPQVVIKKLSKPWIDVLWFNRPLEEVVQEEESEIAVQLNYRLFDKNLSFFPLTGFNYILNEFKEKTTPAKLSSMILSEEGMEDTDAELIHRMVLEKTKQLIKGGFVLSV